LIVLGLLSACALPVRQEALQQPIVLSSGRSFVLTADATCSINTGYSRTLRQGTHWQLDGTIPQGDVYRSPDQTLTVEGFNVHEAFPVVQNDALVGFYLPVEKTFTPTSKPVPLMLNRNQGENE
jgi:hypothetical protein